VGKIPSAASPQLLQHSSKNLRPARPNRTSSQRLKHNVAASSRVLQEQMRKLKSHSFDMTNSHKEQLRRMRSTTSAKMPKEIVHISPSPSSPPSPRSVSASIDTYNVQAPVTKVLTVEYLGMDSILPLLKRASEVEFIINHTTDTCTIIMDGNMEVVPRSYLAQLTTAAATDIASVPACFPAPREEWKPVVPRGSKRLVALGGDL
jgi:hypothetical protein